MMNGLLCRTRDALLEMTVIIPAQEDLALQAWRQCIDQLCAECATFFLGNILPAIIILFFDNGAIFFEYGMQKLPEIHGTELILPSFLQFQAIGGKMRERALVEFLEAFTFPEFTKARIWNLWPCAI